MNDPLQQTKIWQSILNNMGDGVVVVDENARFVVFNPAAQRIIGMGPTDTPPEEWPRLYGVYLPDTVTPFPASQLPLIRAMRGEEVDELEVFVRHEKAPDGIWISGTARPLRDEKGNLKGGVTVFRDVTERKRIERRLAAQHAATRVLAESATLNDAAPRILEAICESLGWDLGALWRVDQQTNALRCVETWRRRPAEVPEFEALTRGSSFVSGIGLPGRVWASAQPAWIADVTQDANFPRAAVAAEENLHGAFGFPILLEGEVLGVIEFFSREIRKPDDDLLTMMASIGSQIGQFIERRRAEEALRESEQRLQAILDNSTAVIYVKDTEGRYILNNRQFETLFHVTRDQSTGKSDYDLFPKEMADAFRANDLKVLEAGRPLEFDELAPHDDGLHAYISIKFPLYTSAGVPYAVCGISTDITQRKQAEQALIHERYLLHALMDHVPDAIYFKDADGRFIRINQAHARRFGLADPTQATGKTDFDFFTQPHAQQSLADEQEVMRTGEPLVGKEEKETWFDGRETWASTTKLPLHDQEGKVIGTFGISRDITKSKQAELALRDSEALYHSLVETLPLNVLRKDLEGRFTFGNKLFLDALGRSLEEFIGKTDFDFFPRELAEKYRQDDKRIIETRETFEDVEGHQRPDGQRIYVQVIKSPVYDARGEVVGTQGIFWDVTARKQAEESLRISERRYRQLTEGTQDAIVVANQQGIITLFNLAAQKTFGYTEQEVLGQPITILMPPEFHQRHSDGLHRFLSTRQPKVVGRTVELRGQRKTGEVFPMDLSLSALDLPEGMVFLGAIRDATQRHQMQTHLVQTDKLASLGLLSAGLAHEINNPLAYVGNNLAVLDRDIRGLRALLATYEDARVALESVRPDTAAKAAQLAEEMDLPYVDANIERILESTRQGVKRVADIVQNLRGFARLDRAEVDRVNIHDAIASSLELIKGRLAHRNIAVAKDFAELPLVECSPAQINQVFLNLLVNAMQAIEVTRKPGGQIRIRTRAANGDVIVDVADDGCGIAPEVMSRIFDPFFTTKAVGEGTGLGLSITHSIVRGHGGRIEVESTPGHGTQFRVILPVVYKESGDER